MAYDPDYFKKYREANREKFRKTQRKYWLKNKKKLSEKNSLWRKENSERFNQLTYRWKNKNKEKVRCHVANRRALKSSADGKYTSLDIRNLLNIQNNLCVSCNTNLTSFHVDHIIPLSRGGSNWPNNLQILCPYCNISKGNKTMKEWLEFKNKEAA